MKILISPKVVADYKLANSFIIDSVNPKHYDEAKIICHYEDENGVTLESVSVTIPEEVFSDLENPTALATHLAVIFQFSILEIKQ